ncbi:S-layer homology domain-containing protein [Paenibacillus oryzisoli]|uniref:S-layer homology domain-containing protein n=1 Tax=Paenibacillus oryzisoli TaxID=1850517 RepID=UPI003D2B9826
MPIKHQLRKLIVVLAAAGLMWSGANVNRHEVRAETGEASGVFNMSYLFAGGPSTYTTQVDRSGETLDVVSPSYLVLNADGSLKIDDSLQTSFITAMHQEGKRVVPFLSNEFDPAIGAKALENSDTLVNQLAAAVSTYNLDGVQFDIENVDSAYRDKFTALVKKLRERLPSSKEVSVAVAANPTGSTKGWVGVFDYKALAAVSDYLMVMTYDESYPGDPTPGPVASMSFVEKSIQYAVSQAPASKIVLGVPFYGRYWNGNATDNGAGIPAKTVPTLVSRYSGTVRYDTASQSPVATFTIKDTDTPTTLNGKRLPAGSYTVWYENEQSLKAKLQLVSKYKLKGTGSWSLNQELPDTWNYFNLWADGFYFTDMQTHWAQKEVLAAANLGWMLGVATNRFAPEAKLTRAEAATIIVRALGLDKEKASSAAFLDVSVTHWASQAIGIAKQHGLMQGISDNVFAPDQTITREEMSMLLTRALKLSSPGIAAASKFKDVPAGSWSTEAIAAMSSKGLVDGFADGTFRPGAPLTRAEMAALLSRAQALFAAAK